jgi:hypothetical protein
MKLYDFQDRVEVLGALYKYWLIFPGYFVFSDRLIDHCLNIGMEHVVFADPAGLEEFVERLIYVRAQRGVQFESFTYFFERDRAIFIFFNPDDAFMFSMVTPT